MKFALTIFVGLVIAFAAASAEGKTQTKKQKDQAALIEQIEHCEHVAEISKSIQQGRVDGVDSTPTSAMNRHRRVAQSMVKDGLMTQEYADWSVTLKENLTYLVFIQSPYLSPQYVHDDALEWCMKLIK